MSIVPACITRVLRVIRLHSADTGVLVMDTAAPHTPLTIIIVEDNPVDVYLIRWVLVAYAPEWPIIKLITADRARLWSGSSPGCTDAESAGASLGSFHVILRKYRGIPCSVF